MPGVLGPNIQIDDVEISVEVLDQVFSGTGQGSQTKTISVGRLVTEYEVNAIYDVRNLGLAIRYVVTARQRLVIPGPSNYLKDYLPQGMNNDFTGYDNYPIMLWNGITPQFPNDNPASASTSPPSSPPPPTNDIQLQDYFPRTIDTMFSTNGSTSVGADQSTSQQTSVGSNLSQTNTHSTSENIGFMGKVFGGGLSHDNQSSRTAGVDASSAAGGSSGQEQDASMSNAMSLKSWAAFGHVRDENASVAWTWGQQYPWNIFVYNWNVADFDRIQNISQEDDSPYTYPLVVLPENVQAQLGGILGPNNLSEKADDATMIYPPSDISAFGLDVVATARWFITPASPSADGDEAEFVSDVRLMRGAHGYTGGNPAGTISAGLELSSVFQSSSGNLNLTQLALQPIIGEGIDAGAAVGFANHQFVIAPQAATDTFRIQSQMNNLLVTGTGFTMTQEGVAPVLLWTTSSQSDTASLDITFKVASLDQDLVLFMRNWKNENQGIHLTISINGGPDIYRVVDDYLASGGSSNVTEVALKNSDFGAFEYYNYLRLGLNTISITVGVNGTLGSGDSAGYGLHSIAIA